MLPALPASIPEDREENMDQYFIGSWKETADKDLEDDLADFEKIGRGEPVPSIATPVQARKNFNYEPSTFSSSSSSSAAAAAASMVKMDDRAEISSTKSVLSGVSVNGNTQEELERAEATIRSKLRECRSALASFEVGLDKDPEQLRRIQELVRLTQACADALRSFSQS